MREEEKEEERTKISQFFEEFRKVGRLKGERVQEEMKIPQRSHPTKNEKKMRTKR